MKINDIIAAIAIKLEKVFGDVYEIYDDEMPQEFNRPAFFIQFLSLEQIQQTNKRWRINTLFNVQYFPQNGRAEAANMTLKIQQALKEITLFNGSLMQSTGAKSEVVDGIANNFMNFNFFLQEVEERIFMESLKQHSRTKG